MIQGVADAVIDVSDFFNHGSNFAESLVMELNGLVAADGSQSRFQHSRFPGSWATPDLHLRFAMVRLTWETLFSHMITCSSPAYLPMKKSVL